MEQKERVRDWDIYTIAVTPRQYRSHIVRNLLCPPRSQSLIVTLPFVTFRMLNPTWLSAYEVKIIKYIHKREHKQQT